MIAQTSLVNEPPKMIFGDQCCTACYYAKNDRCDCRCNGRHHGMGRPDGEWTCIVCETVNPNTTYQCQGCGEEKGHPTTLEEEKAEQEERALDTWSTSNLYGPEYDEGKR